MNRDSLPHLQRGNVLYAVVGMALYFSAANLGAAVAAAGNSFSGNEGNILAAVHLGGVIAGAVLFSLFLRKKGVGTAPRFASHFLSVLAVLCAVTPFLLPKVPALPWTYLFLPAGGMCFLMPAGLYLFAENVAPHHRGLAFGGAIAAGELVWFFAIPALGVSWSNTGNPELVWHVYKLLGVVVGGMAFCFAAIVWPLSRKYPGRAASARAADEATGAGTAGLTQNMSGTAPAHIQARQTAERAKNGRRYSRPPREAWRGVFLLLTLCALFYTLCGLIMGRWPRGSDMFLYTQDVLFVLLPVGPVAGLVLDAVFTGRAGGSIHKRAYCFFLGLLLPLVCLLVAAGFWESLFSEVGLGLVLLAVRFVVFITVFALTARLILRSPYFPLFGALVWGMLFFHMAGFLLMQACSPAVRLFCIVLLALATAVCLWRIAVFMGRFPALFGFVPMHSGVPHAAGVMPVNALDAEQIAEDVAGKRQAFAEAFGLTRREADVLGVVLCGLDTASIARELNISEHTVKYHISGLLKKTDRRNRQRLLRLFALWQPGDLPGDISDE